MVVGFSFLPVFFRVIPIYLWYTFSGAVDLYLFYYSFDWYEVTQTTAFRLLLLISLLTLDVSIYVITQPDSLWKTTAPNLFKEVFHHVSVLCGNRYL